MTAADAHADFLALVARETWRTVAIATAGMTFLVTSLTSSLTLMAPSDSE